MIILLCVGLHNTNKKSYRCYSCARCLRKLGSHEIATIHVYITLLLYVYPVGVYSPTAMFSFDLLSLFLPIPMLTACMVILCCSSQD